VHFKLCEDADSADKYHFAGSQFVKNDARHNLEDPSGFDFDSVMLYDIEKVSDVLCRTLFIDSCVLVKIDRDANGRKITGSEANFKAKEVPSVKGAAFVMRFCEFAHAGLYPILSRFVY